MNDVSITLYGSKGTTQPGRFLTQIGTADLQIDNNTLVDDLALVAGLSDEFLYYNFLNKVEGTWAPFFKNNYLFALASVAAKNVGPNAAVRAITGQLNHSLAAEITFSEVQVSLSKQLFSFAFELLSQIDSWYHLFAGNLQNTAFFEEIMAVHRKYGLSALFAIVKQYLAAIQQKGLLADGVLSFSDFDLDTFKAPIWLEQTNDPAASYALPALVISMANAISKAEYACGHLKKVAGDLLKKELSKSADLSPHSAMFITFCQLHAHVRSIINEFAKKHLDHYYRTVLKQKAKPASPDSLYLSFTLNGKVNDVLLPAGTLLNGKASDGTNLEFITDDALTINAGALTSLIALYINKDDLSLTNEAVENLPDAVTGIYTSVFNEDYALKSATDAWPILNSRQTPASTLEPAMLGFAISSPVLLLQEGYRTLTAEFTFGPLQNGVNGSTGLQDILQTGFLKSAILFEVTTVDGWVQISPSEWTFIPWAGKIIAVFTLTPQSPAITSYNQLTHGSKYDVAWPVLKGVLNNNLLNVTYQLFTSFELVDIALTATVTGFNDVIIYNSNNSRVAPAKPFQPFGAVPVTGAGLIVGSNETAVKNLSTVTLNLQWANLPYQGFFTYYQGYNGYQPRCSLLGLMPPIDNTTFKADISVLNNDVWPDPLPSLLGLELFTSVNTAQGPLNDQTVFVIDSVNLNAPPVLSKPTTSPINYTGASKGFYKISLAQPPYAFGHTLYPVVLANILTKNGQTLIDDKSKQGFLFFKSKTVTTPLLPLPNAPYTPAIKQISIDYVATDTLSGACNGGLSASTVKLFHISPFSTYEVQHRERDTISIPLTGTAPNTYQDITSPFLVPGFTKNAYLYFNLAGMAPLASINLLWHILPNINAVSAAALQTNNLQWQYLANNNWEAFDDAYTPQDQTNGFLNTGIIKISLPGDITAVNTIMPDGYWIRVSTAAPLTGLGALTAVYGHAVKATRSMLPPVSLSNMGRVLPSTIHKLNKPVPQIKTVAQPLSSFGGRNAESEKQFYTRVSERLRHKQRAITPWDYEHIILEQFPELYFARCLSHTAHDNSGNYNAPGKVLLVLIPYVHGTTDSTRFAPRLSPAQLLKIKQYITALASPFAFINVINPTYIYVQVNCTINTNKINRAGKSLTQLQTLIDDLLTPWLYDGHMEGNLDFTVLQSILLSKINSTGLVNPDTVPTFNLLTIGDDGTVQKIDEGAIPFMPWCVFTTYGEHNINIAPAKLPGIGDMAVEKNFYVGNNNLVPVSAFAPSAGLSNSQNSSTIVPDNTDGKAVFSIAYGITMQNEGGYADNAYDSGGETWKGVARNKWPGWAGWPMVDAIKTANPGAVTQALNGYPYNLDQALYASAPLEACVQSFYRLNFWDNILLGDIDNQPIANQLFDTAVNMGPGMACWLLKKAIHLFTGQVVLDEFVMEPETIVLANKINAEKLYDQIISERRAFYADLVNSDPVRNTRFKNSWMSRLTPYSQGG